MTDIRPVDMPELRSDLVGQLLHPSLLNPFLERFRGEVEEGMDTAKGLQGLFSEMELYHASGPMTELAWNASLTLQAFEVQAEDAPCRAGLMVFGGKIPKSVTMDDGCVADLCGVVWLIDARSLILMPVLEPMAHFKVAGQAVVLPSAYFVTMLSGGLERPAAEYESITESDVLPLLLSAWLLMRQPLASVSEVEVDRAARKRLRRAGQEPKPVRVVELRRPKSSGEHGDGNRDYQHQWIVRGHWRQQWHPKREVHRPVWIAPHIKGPEGAPLIGGEKVYAWKR